MRVVALMLAVAGCGRFGFGHSTPADDASPPGDAVDAPLDPIDAPPGALVVTFGETPTATVNNVTTDTSIDAEVPTVNSGGSPTVTLEGSQKRVLLRFDVTAIPAGKMIVSARLHVAMTAEIANSTVGIAPVLEDWTEGTLSGTAGVANWTQRTATQAWTTVGAGSPGSSGSSIASFQAPATGTIGVDLPASTVRGWIDMPATNFGVVLSNTVDAEVRITSSEGTTPSARPELVVTYFP